MKKQNKNRIVFLDLPKTRVYLRPHQKEDAFFFCQSINNEGIAMYLNHHNPLSLRVEEQWLEDEPKKVANDRYCSIVLKKTDEVIGTIGIHDINWINGTGTTGTFIGREDLLGKGLGTEAKMLWLKYCFLNLNLRQIYSRVIEFNGRSLRYAEKCGYREVGRLPADQYRNGTYHDLIYLMVTKEDWLPLWEEFSKKLAK